MNLRRILPNKAVKFAPAYGLRRTASPLRALSAAYRCRSTIDRSEAYSRRICRRRIKGARVKLNTNGQPNSACHRVVR